MLGDIPVVGSFLGAHLVEKLAAFFPTKSADVDENVTGSENVLRSRKPWKQAQKHSALAEPGQREFQTEDGQEKGYEPETNALDDDADGDEDELTPGDPMNGPAERCAVA